MEITVQQMAIISLIASIIVQGIKLYIAYIKKPVSKQVVAVLVYVPAIVMAYFWARPELPVFPDPVADPAIYVSIILSFVGELIVIASAVAGFASLIYNALLKLVYEKIGFVEKG